MKIGDVAYCAYPFKIIGWDLETGVAELNILFNEMTWQRCKIPIWVLNIGVYPEGLDWCVPGDHHSTDHPDYYQVISSEGSTMRVTKDDSVYEVILGEPFKYLGIYTLVDILDRKFSRVQAERVKLSAKNTILEECSSQSMDGTMIQGTVVRLMVKRPDQRIHHVKVLDVERAKMSKNLDLVAVLHDDYTDIEFEFDIRLLKIKA